MSSKDNFALIWHKETKGMISEAQQQEIFFERVKHARYYKSKTNQENCYFSVNSFVTKRLKDNIFELIGLAIDVDFGSRIDAEYVVRLLEDQEFDFYIPRPSYINFSGYGLHVYWKYENPIPARTKGNQVKEKLIYLHEKINRTFAKILSDYGADQQSTDVTRLLRDTNSYNTKRDERLMVYTIRDYNIDYSLEELQKWLPKIENKEKRIKKAISNVTYIRNYYTLHSSRLQDILKLANLRNYNCIGHRELMCFLTRYYSYIISGDTEKAKETMLELNKKFREPLVEYRLVIDTKSAEKAVEKYILDKAKGYNYSNTRLISLLDISEEEQKYLSSIISTKEKYARKNIKRKAERRNENGLTLREQQKQDLINSILELKRQGLKQIEIVNKLKVSKSVVSEVLRERY